MSTETISIKIEAASNLPTVADQLNELIRLTKLSQQASEAYAKQAAYARGDELQAIKGVQTAITAQNAAYKEAGNTAQTTANQSASAFKGLENQINSFKGMIAAAFTLSEIRSFTEQIIDAKSKVDLFKVGLTQMIGSQIESREVFTKLTEMASKTPFEIEGLMQTTQLLKGMGVATQDLIPMIDMLGNISAVVGTGKLPLIAKAFTDVQSKGVLMKQELNQFAENGVNLMSLLAESMGKPRDEVVKLADAHQISFAQVKKALQDATSEGGIYYGQMAIQSQTLGGQVSNLADLWFMAKARIGDYLEDGLKKTITGTANLISSLAGNEAAITRTVKAIESAVLGYTSYSLLVNRSTIATQALAAATVIKTGVLATGQLVVGTYNLTMITAAGSTEGFTAAQVRSATAARGMWAALAANPILAVVATVGLAVAAYKAYEVATTDMAKATSDAELSLLTEQKAINDGVNSITLLAQGDELRTSTLKGLIQKYPDYFAGLNAEKTSNAELKGILDTVNASFQRRIALAAAAYNAEESDRRLKELVKTREELMNYAEERLGREFVISIQGDPAKLKAALDKSEELTAKFNGTYGEQFKQLMNGQVKNLDYSLGLMVEGFEKEKAAHAKSLQENQKLVDDDAAYRLATIQKRHDTVLAQNKKAIADNQEAADDGDKKAIDAINQANANIAKENDRFKQQQTSATKDYHTNVANLTQAGADKVKTITLLSAAEIDTIVKGVHADTVKQQLAYLDAQEKQEIQAASKAIVSKKASAAQIQALEEDAAAKVLAIHEKYQAKRDRAEWDAYNVRQALLGEYIKGELDSISTIVTADQDKVAVYNKNQKEMAEAQRYVQQATKETAQIVEDTAKQEHIAHRQTISLLLDVAAQASGLGGTFARAAKMVWENMDLISGKTKESLTDAVSQAKVNLDAFLAMGDTTSAKGMKQAADLTQKLAESEQAVSSFSSQSVASYVGLAIAGYQMLTQIADAVNEILADKATWKALAEATAFARQQLTDFYKFSSDLNKETLDGQLAQLEGMYDQQAEMLDSYYAREKELAGATDRADYTLAYFQRISEIRASDMDVEEKMFRGMLETRKYLQEQGLQERINQIEIEKEHIKSLLDVRLRAIEQAYEAEKQRIEDEIDAAKGATDVKIDLIEKERDNKKQAIQDQLSAIKDSYDQQKTAAQDAYDKELSALNERYDAEKQKVKDTYDYKQSLLEQSKADEVEAAGIIGRLRDDVLERYRTDETNKLIAQRNRILATLTNEEEKAKVTEEYDRRIGAVNQEVADAMLDTSKANTIISKQIKNEEKNETERLKQEESDKLVEIETKQKGEIETLKTALKTTLDGYRTDYETKEKELKQAMVTLEADTKTKIENLQTELKNTILGYQNELKNNEITTAYAKEKANRDYLGAIRQANEEMFNANKAIKVIELQTQIALVRAMGGNGDVIRELERVLDMLGGQKFDPGEGKIQRNGANAAQQVTMDKTRGGDGVYKGFYDPQTGEEVEVTYNGSRNDWINLNWMNPDTGQIENVNIQKAQGYGPKTGKRYAIGTEFVDDQNVPNGIDTVPAMLTKGERVLTVEQNRQLGGMSNTELLRQIKLSRVNLAPIPMRLNVPEPTGRLASESNIRLLVDEMRAVRKAVEDKRLIELNIDNGGIAAAIIDEQNKRTYHANQLQFK